MIFIAASTLLSGITLLRESSETATCGELIPPARWIGTGGADTRTRAVFSGDERKR
jgi:hypothetical protein